MIEGIIFDADGTLIDSMPMWKNLDFEFLRMHGEEPDLAYTEVVNKMTLVEGVKYTKERFGLEETEEEILDQIQAMAGQYYEHEAELKPFVREFLEQLKQSGIPMTIASSSQREFIFNAMKRNHIEHYFKEIFSCAQIGINKNHPDVFLMAAECLGTVPENTWVVEDSYHALQTAKKAGFPVLAVFDQSNETFLKETIRDADLYMEDLSSFSRFMEKARR